MSETPADPIALWFATAQGLGEHIGIRFGRLAPGASQPEWFFLPHSEYDGIGGLAELLRRRGGQPERLLQIKYPLPPSWLHLVRMLPRFLTPRYRVEWAPFERANPQAGNSSTPPPAVAWHVFDESSTTQIRRACRKAGVTVNSFLLKHLIKAVRPSLKDQSSVIPWMIPVNLRGKVSRERDTANHSSYVGIRIQSFESIQDIHRNIYAALARGEHWANWYSYQTGRVFTAGIRQLLIAKERAMSQWNLGGFSNLGEWDPEKRITQKDCQGDWLFCPPVLRCQGVGAGCVTFQNRLTLVIQIHPELTTNAAVPQGWMANWIKEIHMDAASFLE